MDHTFLVTEAGQPCLIPMHGPTVFGWPNSQVVIYWARHVPGFAPVFPDQSFLEVVRRREVAHLVA